MSTRIATLTEEEISSILQTFRYDRESGEIIRLAATDPQHQWLVGKPCGCIARDDNLKRAEAAEAERERLKSALGGLVEQVAASETWVKHTDAYEIALIELRAAGDGR